MCFCQLYCLLILGFKLLKFYFQFVLTVYNLFNFSSNTYILFHLLFPNDKMFFIILNRTCLTDLSGSRWSTHTSISTLHTKLYRLAGLSLRIFPTIEWLRLCAVGLAMASIMNI